MVLQIVSSALSVVALFLIGFVTSISDKQIYDMHTEFLSKPDGKRPLGKTRLRLEDFIRMDLQELGWGH
jgi:hypothetical protein